LPAPLQCREKIEADRTGLGAFGTKPMADRFPGVFRHQGFQFGPGFFVLEKSVAGRPKYGGELGPGIRRAHVDDAHRLDARSRPL
jgi:putative salt-induced outer membrane protein YdiY